MLLNNNNKEVSGQQQVVFRQSRPNKPSRKNGGSGGGTTTARNSWSFQAPDSLLTAANVNNKVENIYADPETLQQLVMNSNEIKSMVSRSRLRQRSVSNLNAASLAGVRSRDHSQGSRHHNGTVSAAKGVDYIRLPPPSLVIQDRSEYGNPDGSSAHSTAEREAAAAAGNKETYEVIHQNQTNHLIQHAEAAVVSGGGEAPTLLVRSVSGHSNATTTAAASATTRVSPREVAVPAVRKPHAAAAVCSSNSSSSSSGPIKTEWTFLPSPTAPTDVPLHHREINSKPEESSMVRKGLVWMMRDRIFSRYHERFCILTRNYLHCFKKGSEGSLTQMGNFLFKVSLADVLAVQWLDKRGTAIVCLTLAKEGRLLVKTSLDLQGWFEDLQSCVKETLGRRQTLLHDQHQFFIRAGSGGKGETTPPASLRAGHRHQYVVQPASDRSMAARNRSANRYSLMSDHEVKTGGMSAMGAGSGGGGPASESSDNGNPSGILVGQQQPHSLCYNVPAQMTPSPPPPIAVTTTTTTAVGPPPVPVPYRERSVSFDRSRVSKAEREAKRRSYYPTPSNHVTQV